MPSTLLARAARAGAPSSLQPLAAPSQWCDADGCLPDVMILGTQKAATSALFKLLEREEFACPTARKEEHFFDAPRNFGADNVTAAPGRLAAYRHLFDPSKCAQRGAGVHFVDATPNYLSRPFVAPRIAAAYPLSLRPQLRLIAVLREPVSRGLSWYNHKLHGWTERDMGTTYEGISQTFCAGGGAEAPAPTFTAEAACNLALLERNPHVAGAQHSIVEVGFYAEHLRSFARVVDRRQLLVVNMHHIDARLLGLVVDFVGGAARGRTLALPTANTQDFGGKVREIDCATRARLEALYAPWNAMLYSDLREARAAGRTPPQEPDFGEFEAHGVNCTDAPLAPPTREVRL